ncbi:hypothetical protein [Puniceibacterium sp. IMCC21224]|uniref:hypothetical protein n=1 Tax=Puniceibacterium sp. IMCC21224 TaxID=1618204 RepID=UPI00064D8C71|nr:hypothetical protein [Puniceibacterium sp. IMCC21224]KMK66951.1 hypothetical protein IMCC21224_111813 [Puniceibacterium sp. IMCC21224]
MNPLHLLRMTRWVRHPPSPRTVVLVMSVVAICVGLFVVERWIGWPEALTVTPHRGAVRVLP